MTLSQLFSSYGWQLAIIGLLGTFIIGKLKTPVRNIITRSANKNSTDEPKDIESSFDTVAFLLGFGVAVLLGICYTLLASKSGWIASTEENPVVYDFALYLSNVIGVWLYQISYYQIWKKLGFKKIVEIVVEKIKAKFDSNGNGTIDFDEAAQLVQGLLANGKLSIDDVLAVVSKAAPEVAKEAVLSVEATAGDAAKVDAKANIDKLSAAAQEIIAKVPQEKLAKVANSLSSMATKKMKEVVDEDGVPQRPTVKF